MRHDGIYCRMLNMYISSRIIINDVLKEFILLHFKQCHSQNHIDAFFFLLALAPVETKRREANNNNRSSGGMYLYVNDSISGAPGGASQYQNKTASIKPSTTAKNKTFGL